MKISPLAQGQGIGAIDSQPSIQRSASPDRISRAKAIAAGQAPAAQAPEGSGNVQADKVQQSIRKIKMKTQVSTNRDEPIPEAQAAAPAQGVELQAEVQPEMAINPNSEPEAETPEDTKPLSPQFAALAKQKRALQIERAKLEQEKAELAQRASINLEEYVSKADLKSNPLKVFEAGLTYDDLTQAILQNPQPGIDPVKLREEITKQLKEELFGELSTRDQQQEKQVLAEITRDAEVITAQGDEFEAIRQAKALGHPDFSNGKNAIVDLIHRTWKETGELLDTTKAAELIENQLIEELVPFAKIKKVQSKLMPEVEAPVAQTLPQPKPGVKVMRTLTNRDAASPVLDKRARAIAAFNGTFKRG